MCTAVVHMVTPMLTHELELAPSWSVEYRGIACDDARQVGGVWFYKDPTERTYVRFALQSAVVPLFQNSTKSDGPRQWTLSPPSFPESSPSAAG